MERLVGMAEGCLNAQASQYWGSKAKDSCEKRVGQKLKKMNMQMRRMRVKKMVST